MFENMTTGVENHKECLLIILSSTRGYYLTQENWVYNFPYYKKCDLAMMVTNDDQNIFSEPNITNEFYKNAKYVWNFNDSLNWSETFHQLYDDILLENGIHKTNTNTYTWKEWKTNIAEKLPGDWIARVENQKNAYTATILLYARQILYYKLLELELQKHYTYMILTRSDYYFLCHFNESHTNFEDQNETIIWVPNVLGWAGGMNDRFLCAKSDIFIQTLDVFQDIFLNPQKWLDAYVKESNFGGKYVRCHLNIEKYLAFVLEMKGLYKYVKYFNGSFVTVRDENTKRSKQINRMLRIPGKPFYFKKCHEMAVGGKVCDIKVTMPDSCEKQNNKIRRCFSKY